MVADYNLLPGDAEVRLVGDALRLSAHVLASDKAQLWSQLYGRLMDEESPAIRRMLVDWPEGLWLRPLRRSLTAPGGRPGLSAWPNATCAAIRAASIVTNVIVCLFMILASQNKFECSFCQ